MMAKLTFCIPSRRALPCSWDLSWMHPRLLHLRTMDLSLFCRSPLLPLHLHRLHRPRPAPQSPPALSGADTPTSRALPYSVPSRTPHTPPSPPRASALAPPACATQIASCRTPRSLGRKRCLDPRRRLCSIRQAAGGWPPSPESSLR